MPPYPPVTREHFDAVLFDLDGVLTPTATLHAAAWKQTFDAFLQQHAARQASPFLPFDSVADYKRHVDGKSRHDGVMSFLDARGITLPRGKPEDPAHLDTVYQLAHRKDELVDHAMKTNGVQPYPGSVRWVRQLRSMDFKIGVVSSSRNCQAVLQYAGIEPLFDTRVDGAVAEAWGLPGKPCPDMFLRAARQLGVPPDRTAVVEDALVGVQAGRRGCFRLVIGVAREDEEQALIEAGADCVVSDLGELAEAPPLDR